MPLTAKYMWVPPIPQEEDDCLLLVEQVRRHRSQPSETPGCRHPRVGVVRQEDLRHLCQHLRPEVGQQRVDLDQSQGQHIGTVGFGNLNDRDLLYS